MRILNITGYKFTSLTQLDELRLLLLEQCQSLALKGTILLSEEGININLAGIEAHINSFKASLSHDNRFAEMTFHETYSDTFPFRRLKIKIKKEIITLRQPEVNAVTQPAPRIAPELFKKWLDEKRDMLILDTRNDYEVRFGTFDGATHLNLADFHQLPLALSEKPLEKNKTIVMFCTGGIRCEKSSHLHAKPRLF